MSTYNSGIYLVEQIQSLLKQSNRDWELFIRDDGSTDNTLDIITEYSGKYANIHFLSDSLKKLGPRDSFLFLLQRVKAPYYMFCDHDDVWLFDKIERTYSLMKRTVNEYPNMPVLICTDLCVVDDKLNIRSESLWHLCKVYPDILCTNYRYLSVCNFVTGCTVMINDAVKSLIYPYSKNAPMHDFLIALKVAQYGIIRYLNAPTILYRQHGSNVIGADAYPTNIVIVKLFSMIKMFRLNYALYKSISSVVSISYTEYWLYKIKYFFKRFRS